MKSKCTFFIHKQLTSLLIFLLVLTCKPVFSPAADTVTSSSSGLVHIVLSCIDEQGNVYYIRQGTGFVVTAPTSSTATQCIMTDSTLTTASEDELTQIRKWNGLSTESTLNTQIQLLFPPDVTINATVLASGTDHHYALLQPATALNDVSVFKMSKASAVSRKDSVSLFGYDVKMSILGEKSISAESSCSFPGSVTEVSHDPASITTDINANTGCSGAPLLDADGFVIGMAYYENDQLNILPVDTLTAVLDTLGFTYQTTDPNSDYNVADTEIKEQLATLLAECQQDVTENGSTYSKKTLANYKAAITTAMEVMNSPASTKDNYQSSIDSLQKTKSKLKPVNYIFLILEVILFFVILLFAILNIRQYIASRRYNLELHPEEKPASTRNQFAALIRTDNNEVTWLDQPQLRIGSNASTVDYCIQNHPGISRYHAAIVCKNKKYYLLDNHSTNHTYLNGILARPDDALLLNDGDSITMADIVFTFRAAQ